MNWLAVLPLLLQGASAIKSMIDSSASNQGLVATIEADIPILAPVLERMGELLFPKVAPQLRVAAAAVTQFDPNVTKWLQKVINAAWTGLGMTDPNPNLVVDGYYGRLTTAAVEAIQAKHGLKVDGWAGTLTQAFITGFLSAHPQIVI